MNQVNFPKAGVIAAGVAAAGIIFAFCNFGNHAVDGGYVAYVYSNPIMGKKEFISTINGPGGTGFWSWRLQTVDISVTPWTMEETFDDILAKDKLMMNAQASLVFRIDRTKVREFVENYGALKEVNNDDPASIIKDAYLSFIQQHFRSAIRSEVSKYDGLDASSSIPQITRAVETDLKTKFEGTPFIVESVTIGSTTPPKSVTDGITKKVEVAQAYERQATELAMAQRSVEIKEAEGRAAARKAEQEAEGQRLAAKQKADAELYAAKAQADAKLYAAKAEAEAVAAVGAAEAEAIRAKSQAIGSGYVNLRFVENLDKLKLPTTMVGGDIMKQVTDLFSSVPAAKPAAATGTEPQPPEN